MPFYEYQCQACRAQVEVLQKISDPPLKKCPECGKARLVKLVSAPVFRLKGGGWYETDFKSDKENKRNLVEAERGGDEKSDAKPDDKSETKPAEKTADKPAEKQADKPAAKPASEGSPKARPRRSSPPRKAAPARKAAATRKPARKAPRK